MATAIEFNNISKIYRLGLVSTGTLAHDLKRWWTMSIRGKEDPYLTIGETNDRSIKGESEYVWALRDIDFKVEQGDVVGIIGKNGAGKSTLLKILSKVTAPTTGTIRARGRIGSLLEVGTGFHPEMTGRENIYMNGAILGMSKQEITKKLDEIIDFSGCERYIDTPVKRYSSGMMVRLGFAVAAHLDPEILVVDEVLAVGDAEFQKKAIGKMQDVSRGEGRTVLFVSHNMAAVRNLCKTGIVLHNGSIVFSGTADMAIEKYLKNDTLKDNIIDNLTKTHPRLNVKKILINGTTLSNSTLNPQNGYLDVLIEGEADKIVSADASLIFQNNDGAALARFSFSDKRGLLNLDGHFSLSARIKLPPNMHAGRLKIDVAIHQPNVEFYLVARECCILEVEGYTPITGQLQPISSGLLSLTEE
ncbi:MAG: ABC transporter ATP-binding protein [Bacteroidales bacterium]|nr:ABC transporter ATP-binding protein [Bacteroidales bacterium]